MEDIVTGLVELDFEFFETVFLGSVSTANSSKTCSTGTCD